MAVVMLARAGSGTNMLYHAIARDFTIAAVIVEDGMPQWKLLARRLRRLGLIQTAGQVLFQLTVLPFLRTEARARRREIVRASGLDVRQIPSEAVRRVRSINTQETIAMLRSLAPGVVIVCGTRILSRDVLTSITAPFVNIHAGLTPRYRGVHGGYWAIASGDAQGCGVTVHIVDPGIDTGPVLGQAVIDVTPADNFTTYPLLQLAAAIPLLRAVIASPGQLKPIPSQVSGSRLWSHPTAWRYVWSRLTRSAR